MSAEKIVKYQARQTLNKKGYVKPMFAMALLMIFFLLIESLVYLLITVSDVVFKNDNLYLIASIVSFTIVALVVFLCSPLITGFVKMFTSNSDRYELNDILYFFENKNRYKKALRFSFSYILRLILPVAFSSIPIVALYLIDVYIFKNDMNPAILLVSTIILVLLSLLIVVATTSGYFIATLLFCENQEEKTHFYFKASKFVMAEHQQAPIKLYCSFIPWLFACVLAIPVIYVLPYYTQTMCKSGMWILELKRNGQKNELL